MPARKPTSIKRLEGNPGKRDLGHEPEPAKGKPTCPMWLCNEAKAHWKRRIDVLANCGLMSKADGDSFAQYCQAWAQWKEAVQAMQEQGMTFTTPQGYIAKNPACTIAKEAFEVMNKVGQQFGWTPGARAKMAIVTKKDEKNPWEQLRAS